jgi:hypothetical protein
MTLARVRSGALIGIDGIPVDVEVDIGSGLPAFNTFGLPDRNRDRGLASYPTADSCSSRSAWIRRGWTRSGFVRR